MIHFLFSGLYAAVALGGGLVLRSIRVTAQFRLSLKSHPFFNNLIPSRTAKDIPEEFLKRQYCIFGEAIDAGYSQGPKGELVPSVKIRHQPIFSWRVNKSSDYLPCEVRGVSIEPEFKSKANLLIENEVIGKKVKVMLLDTNNDEVGVRLRLKSLGIWRVCLGERIVGLGLGKVLPATSIPPSYLSDLEKRERRAKRKGLGIWKEEKRTGTLTWLTDPLKNRISSLFQRKV